MKIRYGTHPQLKEAGKRIVEYRLNKLSIILQYQNDQADPPQGHYPGQSFFKFFTKCIKSFSLGLNNELQRSNQSREPP
jgi:hypothetical protein